MLDGREELADQVAEYGDEHDPGVDIGNAQGAARDTDEVAEAPAEAGDELHHHGDNDRNAEGNAKPGENVRRGRGQHDREELAYRVDVKHAAGLDQTRIDAAHPIHRVRTNNPSRRKCHDSPDHAIAQPEDENGDWQDSNDGHGAQEFDQWFECGMQQRRAPEHKPGRHSKSRCDQEADDDTPCSQEHVSGEIAVRELLDGRIDDLTWR